MACETLVSSDSDLRAAILAAFAADSRLVAAQVRVGVLNRFAHLAGVVDSLATRQAAEELTAQIPGIRGIVNRIDAPGAPRPAREINLQSSRPGASQANQD
jgi:osmotically-inducible protein OsmY